MGGMGRVEWGEWGWVHGIEGVSVCVGEGVSDWW